MKTIFSYSFRQTKSVFSRIHYHIVFCTRYRRKIFQNTTLAAKVRDLILNNSQQWGVEICDFTIGTAHIELYVECPPDLSPNQLVYRIKMLINAKDLKSEFPELSKMPNLWTRSCLISTDKLEEKAITRFIRSQKSRD